MLKFDRIAYVAVGMVLGFFLYPFFFGLSLEKNVEQGKASFAPASDFSEEWLETIITTSVRNEMTAQMSGIYTLLSTLDNSVVNEAPKERANSSLDDRNTRIDVAYESADKVIEDVISVGYFDAHSAKTFVEYTQSLPHDQAMLLRAKHMDAVNRGLMSSPLPPEEYLFTE